MVEEVCLRTRRAFHGMAIGSHGRTERTDAVGLRSCTMKSHAVHGWFIMHTWLAAGVGDNCSMPGCVLYGRERYHPVSNWNTRRLTGQIKRRDRERGSIEPLHHDWSCSGSGYPPNRTTPDCLSRDSLSHDRLAAKPFPKGTGKGGRGGQVEGCSFGDGGEHQQRMDPSDPFSEERKPLVDSLRLSI